MLPQSYYEGNLLGNSIVKEPCKKGYTTLCKHYAYPSIEKYDTVYGDSAFVITDNSKESVTDFMEWDAHQVLFTITCTRIKWYLGKTLNPFLTFEQHQRCVHCKCIQYMLHIRSNVKMINLFSCKKKTLWILYLH